MKKLSQMLTLVLMMLFVSTSMNAQTWDFTSVSAADL